MNVKLRDPNIIMKLSRLGSFHQSRLSFLRSFLSEFKDWEYKRDLFDLDKNGFGTAIYQITTKKEIYSLVCFSRFLKDEDRSDRVIADKWDTAYTLHIGKINEKDLDRLKKNVPLQESGRNSPNELVLSRANKSVRLFKRVVECLSKGIQPKINEINAVGYLMRTTAVYGSGKFGLSDFIRTKEVTSFDQPFRAEMLAVYIIREFSVELVEHVAKKQNPSKAIALENNIKQHLGIGNSTGLGMAPFIIKHPKLINKWMKQYTQSLDNIVNKNVEIEKLNTYFELLEKALLYLKEVTTFDEYQITKNSKTVEDLEKYISHIKKFQKERVTDLQWIDLIKFTSNKCNYDTQEIAKVQLLELYPEISEELAEDMSDVEEMGINESQTLKQLNAIIEKDYQWALKVDFSNKNNDYLFWYISAAKLEPRLGERYNEEGSDLEQHLGIAKMVQKLHTLIQEENLDLSVAEYLALNPEFRGIIRRIQSLEQYPFAEVQDNILSKKTIPINMLRFKLSFFGALKFDPRSDKWLRICMFQGAPLPHELKDYNQHWVYR